VPTWLVKYCHYFITHIRRNSLVLVDSSVAIYNLLPFPFIHMGRNHRGNQIISQGLTNRSTRTLPLVLATTTNRSDSHTPFNAPLR